MQNINRLKILPAEKKKTNNRLGEQLGVNATTISEWRTNSSQPSIDMTFRIMKILDADISRIINVPQRHCMQAMCNKVD